jgi:uncharacterized protein (TIGR03435 family)
MNIDAVMKKYLPSAPEERIESGTTRVLNELRRKPYVVRESLAQALAPARGFQFAWPAGIVMAVMLVSALVWRQVPPFSAAKTGGADHHSMAKSSRQQAPDPSKITFPSDVFELASVKMLSPSSEAFKAVTTEETMQAAFTGCPGGFAGRARLDPGRLTIPGLSVLTLVIIAYGHDCTLVEGGPSWARSGEYYEIQALLPPGSPAYTLQDLAKGQAPTLQRMLQNLLAERFRLVLKRELREMPVYALTVANRAKLKLSPAETIPVPANFPPPGFPAPPPLGRGQKFQLMGSEVKIFAHAISMSELVKDLRQAAGRIVVDKTELRNLFDVDLKFTPEITLPTLGTPATSPPPAIPPVPGTSLPGSPTLRLALEEQLGLKLEATKLPIEVLSIEKVERPAEN